MVLGYCRHPIGISHRSEDRDSNVSYWNNEGLQTFQPRAFADSCFLNPRLGNDTRSFSPMYGYSQDRSRNSDFEDFVDSLQRFLPPSTVVDEILWLQCRSTWKPGQLAKSPLELVSLESFEKKLPINLPSIPDDVEAMVDGY
jgi:hypothetical protein